MTKQKNIFIQSEGDQWFKRNQNADSSAEDEQVIRKFTLKYSNGKILEIGCANGSKLSQYQHNLTGYGIDPSSKAIEDGKKRYPNLNLSVGTSDQLNFDDETFDVVVVGFCLYLVDRKLLIPSIKEIDRVLKLKGLLFITDFDPSYPHKRKYHHLPNEEIYSYKMNYELPFLATNQYQLVDKICVNKSEEERDDPNSKVSTCVLKKDIDTSFPTE